LNNIIVILISIFRFQDKCRKNIDVEREKQQIAFPTTTTTTSPIVNAKENKKRNGTKSLKPRTKKTV
jgi:predicted lactoylglutathione lyase